MEQPTILICGNYGAGNFGDELILTGLVKSIQELNPKAIVITSGNPAETAKTYGKYNITAIHFFPSTALSLLKSILTGSLFRSIYHLWKSDIVLFGGGCLFNEKEPASINIWYCQFRWFRRLKKKVVIIGQSFGSFTNQDALEKIKELTTYSEKVFVRDTTSKKTLLSLASCDIEVLLDPALWLQEEDFSIPPQNDSEPKTPYVLLILRDWITIDSYNLQKKFTALSKYLFEKYQLPSQILILQDGISGDEKISNELYEKIHPYTDAPPQNWSTINNMANIYRGASLIVSMRLHGGLFGLILEKPTIFLNYDDKVGSLLADLNLENLLIDPNADQFELKADGQLASASEANLQASYDAFRKSSEKQKFKNYLTKIINSIK